MSGPEERQRAVDLCSATPMTTAQVVEHLGHPTRQCLERWPAKDSQYAGHMDRPIIPLETRTKTIEPVPGGMRGSGPPNGSARASARSATGSGRIERAVWPRCGPKTGTPARPTSQRCDGIGTPATPRPRDAGSRSRNWGNAVMREVAEAFASSKGRYGYRRIMAEDGLTAHVPERRGYGSYEGEATPAPVDLADRMLVRAAETLPEGGEAPGAFRPRMPLPAARMAGAHGPLRPGAVDGRQGPFPGRRRRGGVLRSNEDGARLSRALGGAYPRRGARPDRRLHPLARPRAHQTVARLDESCTNTVKAREWLRDHLQENVRSPSITKQRMQRRTRINY